MAAESVATRNRRATSNFCRMSNRKRRRRGTPVVQLNLTVNPDAKAKIDQIADTLGLSEGIIFDLIMEHIEVDEHGRPTFYDGPLPEDQDPDQEDLYGFPAVTKPSAGGLLAS